MSMMMLLMVLLLLMFDVVDLVTCMMNKGENAYARLSKSSH